MQRCAGVVIKVYVSVKQDPNFCESQPQLHQRHSPKNGHMHTLQKQTCDDLGMNWTNLWLRARSWSQSSGLLLYLFGSLTYCSCCSTTENMCVVHQKELMSVLIGLYSNRITKPIMKPSLRCRLNVGVHHCYLNIS